jgi:APA family basic amino acid/polyamine antiporter
MARDGLFFARVGRVSARTQVPVTAIVLQGAVAAVVALSGRYEQILGYVVCVDFLWFGLTGLALLVGSQRRIAVSAVPGHPWTTGGFVLACWTVAAATIRHQPLESGIGLAIVASGVVAYVAWRRGPTLPPVGPMEHTPGP